MFWGAWGAHWGPCPPWTSGLTKPHGLAQWTYMLFAPLLLCSPQKAFIMMKLSKLSKVRNCTGPLISLPTPGRGPITPSQGGCSRPRAAPASEGLLSSRSVSAGSIFLKQQQLKAVSECIYFTNSLVFFQGVEAVAFPLLQ